jgi:hypothetical protein
LQSESQIDESTFKKDLEEVIDTISIHFQIPKNVLEIRFAELSDVEFQKMLIIFGKQHDQSSQEAIQEYVNQLHAIKHLSEFNVICGRNAK